MRIDPRLIAQTSDVAATQRKKEAEAVKAPPKAADAAVNVELSGPAEALKVFGAAIKAGPATRAEKVAQLREAVEKGTYKPTGESVANAIIERGAEQLDIDDLRK
ncbi:MAG: flagellar biosynthesis anti-sigma factor FlgM [Candidatus Sericytochromatia bacterium]|nr:flagellar biosynthesis anti-sigma factor FlgM [Candidatus Tanganyikabacteria bacterium]